MAGYSGTPLAKKLGLKEGQRIALHGAPEGFLRILDPLPPGIIWRGDLRATVDGVLLFAPMVAALETALLPAATALTPAGMLWVAWPAGRERVHRSHRGSRAGVRTGSGAGGCEGLRHQRDLVRAQIRAPAPGSLTTRSMA